MNQVMEKASSTGAVKKGKNLPAGQLIPVWFVIFLILIVLAVSIPLLAWWMPCIPQDETRGEWIQRSGAITVVLALAAEFTVFRVYQIMESNDLYVQEAAKRYRKWPLRMTLSVSIIAAIGTILSAYGDLLI